VVVEEGDDALQLAFEDSPEGLTPQGHGQFMDTFMDTPGVSFLAAACNLPEFLVPGEWLEPPRDESQWILSRVDSGTGDPAGA
jgi:hypothetical protein